MSKSERAELEDLQSGLLRCLLGLAEAPEGIDLEKAGAARRSLLRKRQRLLELNCPGICRSMSHEEFDKAFAQFCAEYPSPHRDGANADAKLFDMFFRHSKLRKSFVLLWAKSGHPACAYHVIESDGFMYWSNLVQLMLGQC